MKGMAGWGGVRKGAGRPPGTGRRCVLHRARPEHKGAHPVNVTLRVSKGLPSLRKKSLFRVVKGCIASSSREDFRVLHFSVQGDHLHLIAEADDRRRLISGVHGLTTRTARAVNRALGRTGRFWGDRYHARALRTPREVRNALVYVLMNVKKHHPADAPTIDPCSSAPWFNGFRDWRPPTCPEDSPIQPPRTWLASEGWHKYHPLLSIHESPKPL